MTIQKNSSIWLILFQSTRSTCVDKPVKHADNIQKGILTRAGRDLLSVVKCDFERGW